jgi:predicted component of type VI protein secretion system
MKTHDGEKMSGIPMGTPGSAEGVDEETGHDQSQPPISAHTPGSAEGEDDKDDDKDEEKKD